MQLLNATKMQAGYTMGLEPSGRELLVVVVKGTFHVPASGVEPGLHEDQVPLVMADTFTGKPGFSAPVHEVDFAPRKRRCDVLLIGSAYAPGRRPTDRVPVGVKVGNWSKKFAVVGDRHWDTGLSGVSASAPQSFTVKPISYDVAFGGTDLRHENPSKHAAFMANPVGRGFHKYLKKDWVDGSPLPNTEEMNRVIAEPDGDYTPMAFGPIGRSWATRSRYAGTYDQKWIDEHFPFLPPDFDEQYYQATPLDQQIDFPKGGEEVLLGNLVPEGKVGFKLPVIDVPVHFFPKRGDRIDSTGTIDTLVLEPDTRRFTMTWRTHLPLRKNMFEISQVLVGTMSRAWWRARESGKTYYRSLAELSRDRREEAVAEE
jgi:hypothetical protein